MSEQVSEEATIHTADQDRRAVEAALIKRQIEPEPRKRGRAEARIEGYGVSIWVLIDLWESIDGDSVQVAQNYALPEEAVPAALAYYRQHKYLIDARIALYNDEISE